MQMRVSACAKQHKELAPWRLLLSMAGRRLLGPAGTMTGPAFGWQGQRGGEFCASDIGQNYNFSR